MKLTDLDNKPVVTAKKALSQNYEMSFNTQKLGMVETSSMLNKVRNLIREAREAKTFYQDQSSPSYMKLVFMEQALSQHYATLKTTKPVGRIVVENEEVEKSQVVLAAQDMVDSMQKMLEDVSDMLVKELPALTTGISNEMGEEASQGFTQQASEALTQLQAAVTTAKTTLQGALGGITGQGGMDMGGGELPGADMGAPEMGGEEMLPAEEPEADMGAEMPAEMPPAEEPEAEPVGGVGRAKR
jgi:hypothetical protein